MPDGLRRNGFGRLHVHLPTLDRAELNLSIAYVAARGVEIAHVFWTFLWGWYGAFIGVPIAIAMLTFCEFDPASRFIAHFLGGPE
jgi:hypothetical protein